jgi:hypothetical protein
LIDCLVACKHNHNCQAEGFTLRAAGTSCTRGASFGAGKNCGVYRNVMIIQPTARRAQSPAPHQPDRRAGIG